MTPIDALLDEIEVNFKLLQASVPETRGIAHATLRELGTRLHDLVADPHAHASWDEFYGYCESMWRPDSQIDELAAVGCLVFIRHRVAEGGFWKPAAAYQPL